MPGWLTMYPNISTSTPDLVNNFINDWFLYYFQNQICLNWLIVFSHYFFLELVSYFLLDSCHSILYQSLPWLKPTNSGWHPWVTSQERVDSAWLVQMLQAAQVAAEAVSVIKASSNSNLSRVWITESATRVSGWGGGGVQERYQKRHWHCRTKVLVMQHCVRGLHIHRSINDT